MKRKFILICAVTLLTQNLIGQISSIVEGSKWQEVRCNYWTSIVNGIYHVDNWRIEGDTIINGVTYKKLYNHLQDFKYGILIGSAEDSLVSSTDYFYGGIREENQKVYIFSDDFWYPDVPLTEKLMFDYSASVGDTITIWCRFYYLDYLVEDIVPTIMNDGSIRNKFILGVPGPGMVEMTFIEGIGSSYGVIGSYIASTNDQMQHLLCFSINDNIVLKNIPTYTSNCLVDPIQESCNPTILSIESLSNPTSLIIYPNPTSSELFVKLEKNLPLNIAYRLYSPLSNIVLNVTPLPNELTRIDVSMLPTGIYFLEIVLNESERIVRKIVVEN